MCLPQPQGSRALRRKDRIPLSSGFMLSTEKGAMAEPGAWRESRVAPLPQRKQVEGFPLDPTEGPSTESKNLTSTLHRHWPGGPGSALLEQQGALRARMRVYLQGWRPAGDGGCSFGWNGPNLHLLFQPRSCVALRSPECSALMPWQFSRRKTSSSWVR